jgi:hypothetical protein
MPETQGREAVQIMVVIAVGVGHILKVGANKIS